MRMMSAWCLAVSVSQAIRFALMSSRMAAWGQPPVSIARILEGGNRTNVRIIGGARQWATEWSASLGWEHQNEAVGWCLQTKHWLRGIPVARSPDCIVVDPSYRHLHCRNI